MAERIEPGAVPDEQKPAQTRRPWHAPEFYMADVESTETTGHSIVHETATKSSPPEGPG
jgi:hypothetical protein